MKRLAVILLVMAPAVSSGSYAGQDEPASYFAPAPSTVPLEYREAIHSAAESAGVPVRILAGIAFAESSFRPAPVHPDPFDRGMFGLHETPAIRAERVARYGEYDPLVPGEAARVAAGILADHRVRLGSWIHAVSAYRQGARGLSEQGIDWEYVWRVMR